ISEALTFAKPRPGEPPEFTAIKGRFIAGQESAGTRIYKELQKAGHRQPKNEEIPFLLGQLYLEKLWVGDGLKELRRAIELDPSLRSNPFVIRAAINGLGNDRDAGQVRRFLIQDIGSPAVPFLEEVLYGDWRQQVKERAAAVLREVH